MDKARDLIMVIAKALVDNPDEVSVNVRSRENTVMFELTVAKEDIGKIIGRQGKIADAVRALLSVRGGKARKNLVLEINDQKWPHAFQ